MDNYEVSDEEYESLRKELKGKIMGENLVYDRDEVAEAISSN